MRLVFAGTPEFAARALEAIVAAGHQVALVLAQPDRPAGRGQLPAFGAVKRAALSHGLPLEQPASLRGADIQRRLADCGAAVMVVAAYGLILPPSVLAAFAHGCINIHASLLPRWRGAAPIQRAIEAGDARTGITIMRMDAGLDTGPMLLAEPIDIGPQDTAGSLHDALAALGARLVVDALAGLAAGTLSETPQPEAGATYARKLDKAEAAIDWRLPAEAIERRIRAFDPAPGATTALASRPGVPLKIWRARVVQAAAADAPDPAGVAHPTHAPRPAVPAGTVTACGADGLVVRCGHDALAIELLQKPGGKRLAAADFLRGFAVSPGERFACPAP